jgi:ABC-type multidrug transport system fused ATPase/permease subunit
MATNPRQMRREDDGAHAAFTREMREHLRANNKQVAALTASMAQMTEKVSEFITAVEVMRVTQEQHAKAIDGLIEREEARAKTAADHRFTLGNNAVFWTLGALSLLFGLINVFNFIAAHWH